MERRRGRGCERAAENGHRRGRLQKKRIAASAYSAMKR